MHDFIVLCSIKLFYAIFHLFYASLLLLLVNIHKNNIDFLPPPLYNFTNKKLYKSDKDKKGSISMRITIDTKENVIICPKPFWEDIKKANEVLRNVGQPELNHKEEVKKYFEKAIANDLVRASDVKKSK